MTLITTPGDPAANGYVSVADFEAYCDSRGLTIADGDEEAAIVRATAYIDSVYRTRFTGYRTARRSQALEWPRVGAYVYIPNNASDMAYAGGYDPAYDYLATDEIPVEIVNATCEAAIRELAAPGALTPDLDRGGAVKLLKAGSVEIEYAGTSSPLTTWTAIENALSGLLRSTSSMGLRAVRG